MLGAGICTAPLENDLATPSDLKDANILCTGEAVNHAPEDNVPEVQSNIV